MDNSAKKDRSVRENRWIRKMHNDEKDGFESLYRSYYPKLIQFALRYNNSKAIAEDLVHNVFHNVWKNRKRIKPNGKLRSYLYTAVRNQSIKYQKRKERQAHSNLEDETVLQSRDVSPEENLDVKEFEKSVEDAINKLPEKRREVFLMSREDNLTYREIANVLEISIKTVETQISRSLKFLRVELAHFLTGDKMST